MKTDNLNNTTTQILQISRLLVDTVLRKLIAHDRHHMLHSDIQALHPI